jgi:MFS family permease
MRELFRRRDFRLLFAGVVATMTGESVLFLVLAIWVKDLTGSTSMAGLTLFALAAPALFAPVLGWVVDRFRRKRFLVTAVFLTAVAVAPLMLVRDRDDVWLFYAVGVLYGVSLIVVSAALNGLIKELLPEELLADANGALQTVRQGLRLVGPLGGAGLFTAVGGPAVVAFDIVCLVAGGSLIAAVGIVEAVPDRPSLHWLSEIGAGFQRLFGPAALRRATLGLLFAVTVIGFVETLGFAYVDLGLHKGPAFLSVLVCVQGVGGLIGGLTAAPLARRFGEIGVIAIGFATFVAGFAALARPQLVLGFAASAVLGLGIPYTLVGFSTLMQRMTPAAYMGRVSAAAEAVLSTMQAISIAVGAALVAVVDFRILFVAMAAVLAVAAVYVWSGRGLAPPLEGAPAEATV